MSKRQRQRDAIADAAEELTEAVRQARELLAARYRDAGMIEAANSRNDKKLVATFPELATRVPEPPPVINVREVPGGSL